MKALIKSEKIYFFLLLIVSSGIALQVAVYKIAIIALILQWILDKNFKQKFLILKANNYALGLILIYFLYAISLFWSDNFLAAASDIFLKSPLLIFPLVILSRKESLSTNKINQILLSFALSSVLINLYCLFDAYFSFIKTYQLSNFYYYKLPVNMHTAYQSMFTSFSIVIFAYLRIKEKFMPDWLTYSLVSFQIILILLLSSRMQILIMMVLVPSYFILYYYNKNKVLLGILYTLLIFSFAKLIMNVPSSLNFRYQQTVSQINSIGIDNDNSDPRKFIWDASLEIIKDNWLIGAGVGDATPLLVERYLVLLLDNPTSEYLVDSTIVQIEKRDKTVQHLKEIALSNETTYNQELVDHAKMILKRKNERYNLFAERKYNFHNQFLQTFGEIGLFGILVLLYLLASPFINAIIRLDYLKVIFLFIICCSLLTESMLERQAGVSFIVFFYTLLVGRIIQNKPS